MNYRNLLVFSSQSVVGHHLCLMIPTALAIWFFQGPGVPGSDWAEGLKSLPSVATRICIGWTLLALTAEIGLRYLPDQWSLLLRLSLTSLLALPLMGVLPLINWLLGEVVTPIQIPDQRGAALAEIFQRLPNVYLRSIVPIAVWIALNYRWYLGREAPQEAATLAELTTKSPLFMKKLSPDKRGELYAISAEQHYIRIYTSIGSDLILMRFSDAVEELADYEGTQIHRSHWVARAGVASIYRQEKKLFVVLRNDHVLPVSRTYERELLNTGWSKSAIKQTAE